MAWQRNSHRIVPPDWARRKTACLTAHSRICHVCLHGDAEQVDHVLNVARGGSHEPENLAPIHGAPCPTCRRRCHTQKTGFESQINRPKRKRDPEPHPGLIA